MMKSLVALAALATLSGAALAQSSVTLYGKIDLGFSKSTGESGGIDSGGFSGSRWGLRGSEDLGGGLKAIFQLESGFNADTGRSSGGVSLFDRQSYVGLEGGFGAFTFGRQYTFVNSQWSGYDPFGGGFGAQTRAYRHGIHTDIVRLNNSVKYVSPSFGGFSGGVLWAPGESGTTHASDDGNYASVNFDFTRGPFSVDLVYEFVQGPFQQTNPDGATSVSVGALDDDLKALTLSASYDIGSYATLLAGIERAEQGDATDDRGWNVGVLVPLGNFALAFNYAEERQDDGVNPYDGTTRAASLGGWYNLSKRTNLYAGVRQYRHEPSSLTNNAAEEKTTDFRLGIRHDF